VVRRSTERHCTLGWPHVGHLLHLPRLYWHSLGCGLGPLWEEAYNSHRSVQYFGHNVDLGFLHELANGHDSARSAGSRQRQCGHSEDHSGRAVSVEGSSTMNRICNYRLIHFRNSNLEHSVLCLLFILLALFLGLYVVFIGPNIGAY